MTDRRIRLKPKGNSMPLTGVLAPLALTNGLMFPFTPTISWNGAVQYSQMQIVHSLQDYYFFANCTSSIIQIAGKFTCQNSDEGQYTHACMHFLRTATKMRFGNSSPLGLPPPVLELSGYGDVLKQLNCVCQNYSIEMPDNVDYVKVTVGSSTVWIPTLTTITVNVILQNTPDKLRTFNFNSFADGTDLTGWF